MEAEIALTIVGLAVLVVGGLCALLFKGLRGDVKDIAKDVKSTNTTIQQIYPWADEKFRTKETCDALRGTGSHSPVEGGN